MHRKVRRCIGLSSRCSCVFAHGVSDMGSEEARMAYQKKQAEKRRAEKDNKMRAYTLSAALTNFSADDAVTQGLALSVSVDE